MSDYIDIPLRRRDIDDILTALGNQAEAYERVTAVPSTDAARLDGLAAYIRDCVFVHALEDDPNEQGEY
jgi:hypothetical protein